ncbi:uncharacterized protein LY89DRAFT_146685 [Mollisia scopiformis]|uniref:Uncharacterized protein n=1 Tax=Mollisia scopiformis TaxID=149040 RepID=A0A194X1A1_MOLSC|nr:uncharacterized protein LY89DRAFT_146685 [Mollisia scopiformis]KUJ13749.1 hypothetical protein LY89DRAFT_146685 [Mollisia scopiformis]
MSSQSSKSQSWVAMVKFTMLAMCMFSAGKQSEMKRPEAIPFHPTNQLPLMPPVKTRERFIPKYECPPQNPPHIARKGKEKAIDGCKENLPRSCSPFCIPDSSTDDVPYRDDLPTRSACAAPYCSDHTPPITPHPHISSSRRALLHRFGNKQTRKKRK